MAGAQESLWAGKAAGIHQPRLVLEAALGNVRLALPLPTIEAEVDRYIAMPVQALAYQLGSRNFRALRKAAEESTRRVGTVR